MASRQLDLFCQPEAVSDILVRESKRARHLSIQVSQLRGVEVIVPPRTRAADVRQFVDLHRAWIDKARIERWIRNLWWHS